MLTSQQSPVEKSISPKSFCSADQLPDSSRDTIVQLIYAGTVHSTTNFNFVWETLQYRLNRQFITVGQNKRLVIILPYIVYLFLFPIQTKQTYRVPVSISRETSRIAEQSCYGFSFFHFIRHRTFDFSGNTNQILIRRNQNDIAFR